MKKLFTPSAADMAVIASLNFKHPSVWLATWFGSGLMRPAPGTWGSLAALPFGMIFLAYGSIGTLLAAIAIATYAGLWACRHFESMTGTHDHKMIVIDEVAGQWIALVPLLLFENQGINPPLVLIAFLLFRFFDILKPWPASYFDRNVSGAWGVMGDDLIAGFYAAIVMSGILFYAGSG